MTHDILLVKVCIPVPPIPLFDQNPEETDLAYVTLREGEDPEALLRRFQTTMQRSGILRELRNRRFFRSKGEQARLDKQRSLRRIRRRRNR